MSDTGPENQVLNGYAPKRLRPNDVEIEVVITLLQSLSKIEENKSFSLRFSNVFENAAYTQLQYVGFPATDDRYVDEPNRYFFKVDAAFLFFDLIYLIEKIQENRFSTNFRSILEKFVERDDSVSLSKLVEIFDELNGGYPDYLSEETVRQLTSRISSGNIRGIAQIFLRFFSAEPTEEASEEPAEEVSEAGATPDVEPEEPGTGTTQGAATDADPEGGDSPAEDPIQQTPPPPQPEQPFPEVTAREALINPIFRQESARFTQIALIQLEQFHGLPAGTLTNSPELRELVTNKSMSYLLGALAEGMAIEALNDPTRRIEMIQEYLHFLQTDFRTTSALANHLETLAQTDPVIKEFLESEPDLSKDLAEAVRETFSENTPNNQLKTELNNSLNALQGVDGQASLANLAGSSQKELDKWLTDLVSDPNKRALAQQNLVNTIDAFILQSLPIDFLDAKYINEFRFSQIFGEEIPYNGEFLEFLQDFWTVRRAEVSKKYDLVLSTEAYAATREALLLLEHDQPQTEQSTAAFGEIVHRTGAIRAAAVTGQTNVEEIIGWAQGDETQSENPNFMARRQQYLSFVWEQTPQDSRVEFLVTYGGYTESDAGNLASSPNYVPPELSIHNTVLAGQQPMFAQTAAGRQPVLHSAVDTARNLHKKAQQGKGFLNNAKNLVNRFGKRGAKEKAREQLEKGLSQVSRVAGTTLGSPILGQIAAMASTKKGRRKLFFIGGGLLGGLGGAIVAILQGAYQVGFSILGALGGGIVGFIAGGPAGAVIGTVLGGAGGYGLGWLASGGADNLTGSSATDLGGAGLSINNPFLDPQAAAQGAPAAQTVAGQATVAQSIMTTTGVQAVAWTVGGVMGGTFLFFSMFSSAFLADFRQLEVLSTIDLQGKQSKYATIEKRVFLTGCPDNRCENPSFPLEAEYSIIISTKDNYTINIKSLTDEIQVHQNSEAWGGSTPNPNPPQQDLSEYVDRTIGPGESIEISYSQNFGSDFNHSSIINTITAEFYYVDPNTGEEGTDTAITGEVFFAGESSQGAGCWPASGTMTQLPAGGFSHGTMDAFDIANAPGTNIYAPFAGTVSIASVDPGYGNHVILTSSEGAFLFGHLNSIMFSGSSRQVQAGDIIGKMGNTGNSTGPHLHFERQCDGKYWFSCSGISQSNSALGRLMPDGNTIGVNSAVRSCYD